MKLHLQIITPTKTVLTEEVDEIIINTISGEIGILPGHVNLLTRVSPGEMIIKNTNKSQPFAIMGGFLEVADNKVTILSDYAVRATDIEVAKAKEAQERAEKVMKNKLSGNEFITAQAELRKAILELKVANKHRIHRPQ